MNANMEHADRADRLYQLLPVIYRQRDAEQGYPLRALLQVIGEQVALVEADIDQLYENWFVETCDDFLLPYIGDLIGYRPVAEGGQDGGVGGDARALARGRIVTPRRDVADTIRQRRSKGTLAVLESLALAVAQWPARAVEFYRLLGWTQSLINLQLERARSVDVRDGMALDRLGTAFDRAAHTVDVRRIDARFDAGRGDAGRHNLPNVGVFVWRLQSHSVTQTPAYCFEEHDPSCYLFSVLGNDTPLFIKPARAGGRGAPTRCADAAVPPEVGFPQALSRRGFEQSLRAGAAGGHCAYYGENKSLQLWVGSLAQPVAAGHIIAADLSGWTYTPPPGMIALDPVLGRIAFPADSVRKQRVWVSYHTGFGADIGGGEYPRALADSGREETPCVRYLVGGGQTYAHINDALAQWQSARPRHAVIEICDSGVYVEPINLVLPARHTLAIRAASGKRPVLRLLNWETSLPDNLSISGEAGSWCTLDGLLITGRGVQVGGEVHGLVLRHCTLVPGWGLHGDCSPRRAGDPSLELINAPDCVTIEHCILGAIRVDRDQVMNDPAIIRVSDSIIDATGVDQVALGAVRGLCAHATLSIARSTVLGKIETHAIALAENCLFMGTLLACRRQLGCVRYCYVPPGSRTPRRHACQPDLVEQAVRDQVADSDGAISVQEKEILLQRERKRVEPDINSTRYGTPTYCQLSSACAEEISRGADDEAEMGVFHDLYQAQRAANLATRLDEYVPAGMAAGIIYVN